MSSHTYECIVCGKEKELHRIIDGCQECRGRHKIKNLVYDVKFGYRHRPIWKVSLNFILRLAQFWSKKQWVVASKIAQDKEGNLTHVVGYKMILSNKGSRGEIE